MFCVTWVNYDNPIVSDRSDIDFYHYQKLELTSGSGFLLYRSANYPKPLNWGKYTVIKSWVDRKGNTYCQAMLQFITASRIYALWRLDESNTVFEENFYYGGFEQYPAKIVTHYIIEDDILTPTGTLYYNIFYRQ